MKNTKVLVFSAIVICLFFFVVTDQAKSNTAECIRDDACSPLFGCQDSGTWVGDCGSDIASCGSSGTFVCGTNGLCFSGQNLICTPNPSPPPPEPPPSPGPSCGAIGGNSCGVDTGGCSNLGNTYDCSPCYACGGSPPPPGPNPPGPTPPPPPPSPGSAFQVEICPAGSAPGCPGSYNLNVGQSYTFWAWRADSNGQNWANITGSAGWTVCNDNSPCLGEFADYAGARNVIRLLTSSPYGSGVPLNAKFGGDGDQVGLLPGSGAPPPGPLPPPPPPPGPPSTPSITSIVNSVCAKLTINWNDVSNETSYQVWRSAGSGGGYVNISGSLSAGTTSYQDTPPLTSVRYYYIVKAINANGTSTSIEDDGFNLDCNASLSGSTKTISQVNGLVYGPNTVIRSGDTVTFQITIVNFGPANATINYICDTPSSNFLNLRNLNVTGGGTNGGITQSSANCGNGPKLNPTGSKPAGNPNWVVTYDTTFQSTQAGALELCSNYGIINFTDGTGTKNQSTKFGPTLCNKGTAVPPSFHEVAP